MWENVEESWHEAHRLPGWAAWLLLVGLAGRVLLLPALLLLWLARWVVRTASWLVRGRN